MTDSVCIDASVGVKWLVHEDDSVVALRLRHDIHMLGKSIISPPHMSSEMASAIHKRYYAGTMRPENARQALAMLPDVCPEAVFMSELPLQAFEIAAQFNLKWIYDAFYVALADIVGCDMWTADATLHRAVHPAFPNVRLLTELRRA